MNKQNKNTFIFYQLNTHWGLLEWQITPAIMTDLIESPEGNMNFFSGNKVGTEVIELGFEFFLYHLPAGDLEEII